jgi:hypothetical protein
MHTKTIAQEIDWLNAIDGRTVKDAIAYLNTLNPDHVLNYNLDGDTHGVVISSDVQYDVPMTNKEILEGLEAKYLKQLAYYEKARQRHLAENRQKWVESVDMHIAKMQKLLDDARAKYNEDDK